MMTIKPIGSTSGEVTYYVRLGHEDYYVNAHDASALWWGRGAHDLGLQGTVVPSEFKNLLLGMSPDGKTKLVQNACQAGRRAAFDLSFSPPKSIDTLFSQGDDAQQQLIVKVCENSLRKALGVFEDECGFTRRGQFGVKLEKAGLAAVICRHETSRGIPGRTPDPNLHWHVVVCNVTVSDKNGSTGTFDARRLFERHMKMCLGALFRAELSKEFEQLGLSSHRPVRESGRTASWFELDCVPKELTTEFSNRRREIEKWLKAKGLSGAKAAEKAALATRQDKEQISRAKLFEEWKRVGREHGFTHESIESAMSVKLPVRNAAFEASAAVERAIKRITEDRAHFSEIELLRLAAEEAQTRGVGISEVRSEVDVHLNQSTEIVRLDQDVRRVRRFTTKEMLELEANLLSAVDESQNDATHKIDETTIAKTILEFPTIKPEQREAVRHITLESGAMSAIQGWAGTGKTFALGVARACFERAGKTVIGTALAAKAAKTLEEGAGINSVHIDRLFWELETDRRSLDSNCVVVLDEAGMVGTRKLEKLVSVIRSADAKLVLVGDHRQLQAIEAGGPFKAIIERIGCAELSTITRQRDKWARDAVVEMAQGYAESALEKYVKRGLLSIAEDRDEACHQLVRDWSNRTGQLGETLILAGTRAETATLNLLCQQARMEKGELSESSITVGAFDLHVGERVLFRKNNAALLVQNGSTGVVTEVEDEKGRLRVRLDDGFEVAIDVSTYDSIQPGYAITTHKGQGQTVENAFVLAGGPMTDREISYVQASRARGETRIYTDILSGGDDIESIAKQMSVSRAKHMAHDYLLQDGM